MLLGTRSARRLPRAGQQRLTLAFLEGPQHPVDVYCSGLGIAIDHMIVVDFTGFEALIDEVGGVEVSTAAPVRDEAAGLYLDEAGTQELDGATALAYIRSRKAVELIDGAWVPIADGAAWRLDHVGEVGAGTDQACSTRPSPTPIR